ncbi:MAG: Retron-type reverse transcriptase [Gemmataceae bacterium]|nr:Retron-type reverse transcriptase [Gemmataceae bacterium]
MSCFLPRTPTRRRLPVLAHAGTREAVLARHVAEAAEVARAGGQPPPAFLEDLFDRVSDTRILGLAARDVARDGGPARGADRIGPDDLNDRDWWTLVRSLRRALRRGWYHPGDELKVQIPKPGGRGFRGLSIPLLADRVLQRALVLVLQPYLDPQFSPTTLGGRPGKSTHHALALATQLAGRERLVVVTADVRKAFDVVPHDRLMAVVRARLGDTRLTGLIEAMVRSNREVGIAQGSALSSLLLNLFLDEVVDRPWKARHPNIPLLRWVDDLLLLCKDRATADAALAELNEMLDAGVMPLKQDPAPAVSDLRGRDSARWLGFTLKSGLGGLGRPSTEPPRGTPYGLPLGTSSPDRFGLALVPRPVLRPLQPKGSDQRDRKDGKEP